MNAEVEKLAEEYAKKRSELDPVYANGLYYGYLEGFKKAMQLNKDKMFTLEQVIEAMNLYRKNLWTMTEVLAKMQSSEMLVETTTLNSENEKII